MKNKKTILLSAGVIIAVAAVAVLIFINKAPGGIQLPYGIDSKAQSIDVLIDSFVQTEAADQNVMADEDNDAVSATSDGQEIDSFFQSYDPNEL